MITQILTVKLNNSCDRGRSRKPAGFYELKLLVPETIFMKTKQSPPVLPIFCFSRSRIA